MKTFGLPHTPTRSGSLLWVGLAFFAFAVLQSFIGPEIMGSFGMSAAIAVVSFGTGAALLLSSHHRGEQHLVAISRRDPLTGLPNRTVLIDRLEHALARVARNDRHIGVLFVDLDHFKSINEDLGHQKGDELLTDVAERLQGALRPGDTAARVGADEFVVLCEDLRDADAAKAVAGRIERRLADPYRVDKEKVTVTASVGVAIGNAGSTSEELLRNADRAMFQAKERGRAQYQMFTDTIESQAIGRLETARGLRNALDHDELRLHYQPVVDLRTGEVMGVEALIRWMHPERGLVFPSEFIDIAESSGAIVAVGRWALHEAGRQAVAGFDGKVGLTIAVNVSARQVARPEFRDNVTIMLEQTGLEPERLCLELTETVLLEAAAPATSALEQLKKLGVRLAIDDFGTGHSSLSYLRTLPVDIVKVDRSFVAGLGIEPHDDAIVEAVVSLGKTFGIDIVAEGVERAEQAIQLAEIGCDYAQGFYYGRPSPVV